ncbi:MAG: 1,2-phenylacetyl-CoA epoxidase subunit PaaC [Parvibaculales bacterium]
MHAPLFEFLLRQGDNTLILSHRVSEWCGHAPVLEEDIALANIALDLLGQAQMWLGLAGEVEGAGRSADDLAMLRDAWDFRNAILVERPNGHFGRTMMRQFLFDAYHVELLADLTKSNDARIAAIAAKSLKEVEYHVERSATTIVALGDGTQESHARMQAALDDQWTFAGELFETDAGDAALNEKGIAPLPSSLRDRFDARAKKVFGEATLAIPDTGFGHSGGRSGKQHSEHLGHLLTQMQWLQRAYPGATW